MRPSGSVWMGAVLLVALVGVTADPLRGQDVSVTPYVAMGPQPSFAAGARLTVVETWGSYMRFAARAPGGVCLDTTAAICDYPSEIGIAGEYALGALYSVPSSGEWGGTVGMGAGFLDWGGGHDLFVEFTGQVRRTLRDGLELLMGLHGLIAPGVEREPSDDQALVPRNHVVFPNAVLGLSFRLDGANRSRK